LQAIDSTASRAPVVDAGLGLLLPRGSHSIAAGIFRSLSAWHRSSMKRIVILTGSELRHAFVRRYLALAPSIEVVRTYCEGLQQSLASLVQQQENSDLRRRHVAARAQSEQDFFGLFLEHEPDYSQPVELAKGQINEPGYVDEIVQSDPDLIVAYGCSLIREPLLSHFQGRLLNVHLGLSPYYRGTGTNFWPLVKGEPELVGATFMHMDQGVDTGAILHQIRARVAWGPGPRASQALMLAARARALLDGRIAPSTDDVSALAKPVLRHRMALNFAARAEGHDIDGTIDLLRERIA